MARNNRAGTTSLYALMKGLVRQEVERLFLEDMPTNRLVEYNPGNPPGLRKAGSQRSKKPIKGRVTSPNDKRLKANREL